MNISFECTHKDELIEGFEWSGILSNLLWAFDWLFGEGAYFIWNSNHAVIFDARLDSQSEFIVVRAHSKFT